MRKVKVISILPGKKPYWRTIGKKKKEVKQSVQEAKHVGDEKKVQTEKGSGK